MDLTLYGICFRMRGSLDLLDYVQSNEPVPIEVMQQVMDQMGSVTQEEKDYARKMQEDWKKAMNERVPFIMGVGADGGYEITCSVPNELLCTVHVLTGLENSKIVEEYTADYLKKVCGIDASIISVDVEKGDEPAVDAAPVQGFDIGDLDAEPEGPAFEDVGAFGDIEAAMEEPGIPIEGPDMGEMADIPVDVPAMEEEPVMEEPVMEESAMMEEPEEEPVMEEDPVMYEEPVMEEKPVVTDAAPVFEQIQDEAETLPYTEEKPEPEKKSMQTAMAGIYRDFVNNIRDKQLDTRLGLNIG